MTATSAQAVAAQREALVDKVGLEVDRRANLGDRLLQYHRVILQDLPFDGVPELITAQHRGAIERLVEKHGQARMRVRVKRIVGYASRIGDTLDNLQLSAQRAEAVHQYLQQQVSAAGIATADFFTASFTVEAKGEQDLPHPTNAAGDNPLNRRVEIVYTLIIDLPPPGGTAGGPVSTLWKVDFGAAGAGWLLQSGAGTLTMLPDGGEGSPVDPVSRSFAFVQAGVSVGLFGKLRKAKFIRRFPRLREAIGLLHPGKASNYPKTSALLQNIGFSVDLVSEGGEFETDLRLSFDDLSTFQFATLSASLSILGKGEAALMLLYSDHFFAPTAILGFGQNIAVPDAEISMIPAGIVMLETP